MLYVAPLAIGESCKTLKEVGMIIQKMSKGYFLCRSPIDNKSYAIIVRTNLNPGEDCRDYCCFRKYCYKWNNTRKVLLKYFGIDKSCSRFFVDIDFLNEVDNFREIITYFVKLEGGL